MQHYCSINVDYVPLSCYKKGMDMAKDTLRVAVTLTDEQHEQLRAAADAVGLTISAYIRMAALEKARAKN